MKRWLPLVIAGAVLAGCGSMPAPFGKDAPLSSGGKLIAPPWETMVKAGPGASKELDLETLNGPQKAALPPPDAPPPVETAKSTPAEMEESKTSAAGKGDIMPGAQPAKQVNIAAVAVLPVKGDSARGNQQLTAAMRETLKNAGWPVRSKKGADTLVISGRVRIGEPRGKQQTVTLAWQVSSPDGKSLGLISQTNDVPAGALEDGWGENATPAVEAAATGIFQLIDKLR